MHNEFWDIMYYSIISICGNFTLGTGTTLVLNDLR